MIVRITQQGTSSVVSTRAPAAVSCSTASMRPDAISPKSGDSRNTCRASMEWYGTAWNGMEPYVLAVKRHGKETAWKSVQMER